jgi:molybdenum-dependent DNA-binding transcriptional regulator ModE
MATESAQLTDDRRITLEQLRTLASILEVGGFQGASYQMHRTQSAVTQSLKKLEEILGCRLLERKQRHVAGLTPSVRTKDKLGKRSDSVRPTHKW